MNPKRLLRIAERMHLLLVRELGQGIDVQRLLGDALYRRDVLLVCDAHVGSDLASLAQHFRSAQAEPIDEQGQPSQFGPSSQIPQNPPSSHGSGWPDTSTLEPAPRPPTPRPLWRSPSRWLGR